MKKITLIAHRLIEIKNDPTLGLIQVWVTDEEYRRLEKKFEDDKRFPFDSETSYKSDK